MSLQNRSEQIVAECMDTFNQNFPDKPFTKWISVVFKVKGHTAGYADYRKQEIDLNHAVMSDKRYPNALRDTTIHEMAHHLAYHLNPNDSVHGTTWQYVMHLLGAKADRCHNYETKPARKTRKFAYSCECGQPHTVGIVAHNRHQKRNETYYRCTLCKEPLHLIGEMK